MEKKPKSEVDYSPGHKESHCGPVWEDDVGYCGNFIRGDRSNYDSMRPCRKVSGLVKRMYWCKLFEKAK